MAVIYTQKIEKMKALSGFRLRPLGNDYILISEGLERIDFNKMITMNGTAAYLWQQIADGSDFDAQKLADLLTKEYEVSTEQALEDVQQTITKWRNAGIIE